MASMKFRGTRAILAGGMLAIVAMSLPAHAAGDPAPVLKSTSLVNGWSHLNKLISASYNRPLVRKYSDVAVKDNNGDAVDGVVALASTDPRLTDARILTFTPDDFLSDARSPYTVTFTAHGVGQDAGAADTVDTFSFSVDTQAPKAPTLEATPAPAAAGIALLAPGDMLKVAGKASDIGDSGVAKFELHFYNPIESLKSNTVATVTGARFDEVTAYRRTVTIACSASCPDSATYTIADATAGLPAGYWTLRVAAIDLAGNRSAESPAVSFITKGA